jgi:hypothetical protein
MTRFQDTIWCDNCGVEITWTPTVVDARDYCCTDCLEGRPCDCGQRMEIEEERRRGSASGVEPEI